MIRAIFFDVDGTLIDFHASAKIAMMRAFEKNGLSFRDEMFDAFTTINRSFWAAMERREITIDDLHRDRWNRIFAELGISFDGQLFERDFLRGLDDAAVPIDGAAEMLASLSAHFPLYVASNADRAQQLHRLEIAGMLSFFKAVFTSGEFGAMKPSPAFFDGCFAALPDLRPCDTVMVGDSLTADIAGGAAYGMKTCWCKLREQDVPPELRIDWTVRSLSEIPSLFLPEET